jgi:hypothetical protein
VDVVTRVSGGVCLDPWCEPVASGVVPSRARSRGRAAAPRRRPSATALAGDPVPAPCLHVGLENERSRFNLLNLGGDPATVCAIALRGKGEVLRCEVVPSVVVRAGARYPFALEVRTGLVSEAVDIQVENGTAERAWVSASRLPSP